MWAAPVSQCRKREPASLREEGALFTVRPPACTQGLRASPQARYGRVVRERARLRVSEPGLVRAERHPRILLGGGQPGDWSCRRGREERRRKKGLKWPV